MKAALLLSALVLLCGCVARGAPSTARVDDGRPQVERGGEAYLVWRDRGGWHLRARSDVPRRFSGEIDAGLFLRVQPVGLAPTAIQRQGGKIAFSFEGKAAETGFDWDALGCPELELYVDGESRPLRVFAGAYGASPARMPFDLCP